MQAVYPASIKLPSNQAVQFKAYANLHEAVTNSVQVAVNLLYR